MGQYRITIEGTGSHHNDHSANDADLIAKVCVAELIETGHSIKSTCFEVGYYDENGVFVTSSGEDMIHNYTPGADGYVRKAYETNQDEGAEDL